MIIELLFSIGLLLLVSIALACHLIYTRRSFMPPRDTLHHPMTHPLSDSQYPHWWE